MIVLTYQDPLVGFRAMSFSKIPHPPFRKGGQDKTKWHTCLALIAAQGCFMLALMLYAYDVMTALPATLDMRSMRCSLDG